MGGRALLSRIGGEGGPADEAEAIVAHLRVLLNTSRGQSPSAPGFGLVDFADVAHSLPGAAQDLARSIRGTILEFEPRLKNVVVRHVPEDGLAVRFEIVGQLAGPRGRPLRFATTFRPGGRVEVTS
jgi:type VI secretion system protein